MAAAEVEVEVALKLRLQRLLFSLKPGLNLSQQPESGPLNLVALVLRPVATSHAPHACPSLLDCRASGMFGVKLTVMSMAA